MDSKKEVTHNGFVKELGKRGIKVGIIVQSGCASCQINGSCNMSEQTDKELDIDCDPSPFNLGQKVVVHLKSSQGMNALFLGYVLPFIVLLTVMIIANYLTSNEAIIGVAALVSLIPYYVVLYLYRNKIKKKFTYVVNPLKS
ncbi:MAG: SoxR reducing system RseC family protein [Prolixibacteraceae bacterium]|jgi:sigma-E factor negative regulatory protein RseC|nr:SoxR reducing system RseC family protein [Prolixibacteraceae bacterium]